MYGLPANYKPAGSPIAQKPTPEPEPIPDAVKQKARLQGGEFISKDGKQIYRWRYDKFYYADWDGLDFGSWFNWESETLPAGELEEL